MNRSSGKTVKRTKSGLAPKTGGRAMQYPRHLRIKLDSTVHPIGSPEMISHCLPTTGFPRQIFPGQDMKQIQIF